MNRVETPGQGNWDNFWKQDRLVRKKEISWSKRRILEVVVPFIKNGGRILDAGCGSGFFANYFAELGLESFACDFSDEALHMTSSRSGGRVKVFKIDLVRQSLKSDLNVKGRFDYIFTDGLLEHFSWNDQCLIMRNFHEALGDSGVLITFVPNKFSPWEIIRPLYMPGINEQPFVLSEVCKINDSNNFCVIKKGGINVLPFAFSPDAWLGSRFGMLLYTLARKA